jgi:lipopolysaccharide transport system permease protein
MIDTFRQLFAFRALIAALVVRHLSIRYRGSLLGFLWSFLSPLCLMGVYTLVFTHYVRGFQVDHYSIFLFSGLLPWIWSSSALVEGTNAIVSSGHLITKSMFPPQILPAVAVITTLVNFLLSIPLLFLFMLIAGMEFHWTLFALPLIVVGQFLFLFGCVLALSALNVFYRDVQHLITNMLTLVFFLCPIIYPSESVPAQFRFSLDFNPLAAITVFYHQLIIEGVWPGAYQIGVFSLTIALVLTGGTLIFNRYREGFAELL